MYRLLLVCVCLMGCELPAQTQAIILDGPIRESVPLFAAEDVYPDEAGTLNVQDVLRNDDRLWRPLSRPLLRFGSEALWVRLILRNTSGAAIEALLEDRSTQTDFLDFFLVQNQMILDAQKSGDHVPLGVRLVPHRYPVFDVQIPPGDSMIYLRYQTSDLLASRLVLSTEAVFSQTREGEKLVFGLLFGCLLIMPLYNVMLYVLFKDPSYLYYTIYGLFYVMFQASINGLFFQYVLDYPWINDELSMVALSLCIFYVYRFLSIFLDLKSQMSRTARVMLFFENAALLLGGIALVHLGSAVLIGFVFHLALVSWVIYTSYVMARRGNRPALFFLSGWILFLIGDGASILASLGLMEDSSFTQWGMLGGSALQMVLVSIAMGYKFEGIRQALIVSEIEKSKLIGSLESARIIQESLVSRHVRSASLEVASYYQSAERTGGDWFSIIDRPDQHFAVFALGDVTGHGLSSSMMTAFACGALEASVHNLHWDAEHMEGSLAKLAQTFNQLLFRTATSNDRLMTMSVFAIDLLRLEGFYVNCGHHASYLLSQEKLSPIFRRGSILGVHRDEVTFSVLPFPFKVGDTILLHSDGLVENSGPLGEHFPMHRVQHTIRYERKAGENLQALIESAEAVWQGHQPDDDVTVLLIRIVAAAQDQKPAGKQTA